MIYHNNTMKVLSIAGFHRSGKTTLSLAVIQGLKKKGYKVVSIKDIHSGQFQMEKIGSNSWKHLQANKEVVFARGEKETYQIWNRQLSLAEMLAHIDADFVIIEGMREIAVPRLVCAIDENQIEELLDETVFALSGIISNSQKNYKNLTIFHPERDIDKLLQLIEEKVFPILPQAEAECCSECGFSCREMVGKILQGKLQRSDCKTDRKQMIRLQINGKEISMVPFVQRILANTVKGFVSSLKGTEKGKIEIEIEDSPQ